MEKYTGAPYDKCYQFKQQKIIMSMLFVVYNLKYNASFSSNRKIDSPIYLLFTFGKSFEY